MLFDKRDINRFNNEYCGRCIKYIENNKKYVEDYENEIQPFEVEVNEDFILAEQESMQKINNLDLNYEQRESVVPQQIKTSLIKEKTKSKKEKKLNKKNFREQEK